jgi:N-acetylglutamate synthase-like GNAT family acetyltransferase
MVSAHAGRRGVGAQLVAAARNGARAAGCEWLHVNFEDHLKPFYIDSCGFTPTAAGLMRL